MMRDISSMSVLITGGLSQDNYNRIIIGITI